MVCLKGIDFHGKHQRLPYNQQKQLLYIRLGKSLSEGIFAFDYKLLNLFYFLQ